MVALGGGGCLQPGLRWASPQLEIWPCPDTAQTAWRWTWDECLFNSFHWRSEPSVSTLGSDLSSVKADSSHARPSPSLATSVLQGTTAVPSLSSETSWLCPPCLLLRHPAGLSHFVLLNSTNLENTGQSTAPDLQVGSARPFLLSGPRSPESHFGSPESRWIDQVEGTTLRSPAFP